MNYYSYCDILSCAQHVEAKILANKMYNRWISCSDRLSDFVLSLGKVGDSERLKITSLASKEHSVRIEFLNLERGLDRCCGYKTRVE